MAKNFRDSLNEQLKNPEFKVEYDALEPEFQIIKAMLDGRNKLNLTQKDLAERTGIRPPTISAICNNSAKHLPIDVLDKICEVLDCQPSDLMEYIKESN